MAADHRFNLRIDLALAIAVTVPALAGLLPEAATLAQPVNQRYIAFAGLACFREPLAAGPGNVEPARSWAAKGPSGRP